MNRKLMAVAVAGVFAAPAAVLAQSSTVQIYGKVTYEYGYADSGDGKPKTDIAQTPGGSAIGFRGEEKLGGGLTAWFQCESSADVRGNSQDGLCSRNSALGFKGAWGNLHFGRWDSPMKRAINMGTVGVQDTGLLGYSTLFSGSSTGTSLSNNDFDRNVWKRRESALTYYESPVFSGFQVLAAFSPGNAATSASDSTTAAKPRMWSIAGTFKNGPLSIGLAYEEHKDMSNSSSTTTALATGSLTTVTTRFAEGDDKGWSIGASYTFMNKLTIGAVYLDTKYETGNLAVPGSELKRKSWNVGLDWAIAGPHGLEVGYTEAQDSKGNCNVQGCTIGNIAPTGNDTGAKQYEIKYRYSFSKRTAARLGYVKLKNDSNSIYTLGGLGKNVGQDQDAIVMYLEHSF